MRQYWLNMQVGMLFTTAGKRIIGKSVKYEQLELNHVKIDGQFYRLGESKGSLVEIIPARSEEFDDFTLHPQCEELYAGS